MPRRYQSKPFGYPYLAPYPEGKVRIEWHDHIFVLTVAEVRDLAADLIEVAGQSETRAKEAAHGSQ